MLVSAMRDTSYWPREVSTYTSEVARVKALKPKVKIIPFGERAVAELTLFGKKGWQPKGTDGRLLKESPWSGGARMLLVDGAFFQAGIPEVNLEMSNTRQASEVVGPWMRLTTPACRSSW